MTIETPRGPVVESLLGRGFVVHSINPKQMDRYRDRFSVAGAKDDRLDARVLAETARLDRSHLRAVDAQMPEVVQPAPLFASLRTAERRQGSPVKPAPPDPVELLPAVPGNCGSISPAPGCWELMMMAPTPQKAKRMHVSSIQKLLRKHRIRSLDAETIKRRLGNTSVGVAKGVH